LSSAESPLISIAIPSLNQGDYLEEALQSVLDQNYPNVELVIVDGGSTDSTMDVIDRHRNCLKIHVKILPALDLYSSLNLAMETASGEFIGWMNCDDYYEKNVFRSLLKKVGQDPSLEIVCGDGDVFYDTGAGPVVLQEIRHSRGNRMGPTKENIVSARLNCCFFKRDLIDRLGKFNNKYKVAADRDYLFRLLNLVPKSAHLGAVVYHYRSHERSLTMSEVGDSGSLLAADSIAWEELLDIALRYCKDTHMARNIRAWSRHYITGYTLRKFVEALKERQGNRAIKMALMGFKYNKLWFVRVLFRFVNIARERIFGPRVAHG
jgi:glycosyltransferase involved in cell wall biosynthesis